MKKEQTDLKHEEEFVAFLKKRLESENFKANVSAEEYEKTKRKGEKFKCQKCYHTGNADINAALNILERFVTGKYGSCYKPLMSSFI